MKRITITDGVGGMRSLATVEVSDERPVELHRTDDGRDVVRIGDLTLTCEKRATIVVTDSRRNDFIVRNFDGSYSSRISGLVVTDLGSSQRA